MSGKKPAKLPAESQLRGVLMVLDQKTKTPTAEVLGTIRTMVQDALDVLQERDPLQKRVAFVLLAVQQSTQVTQRTVRGKQLTRVTIVDQSLYHWALGEIHALAGAA
ncbi:hypothetical protein P6166_04580 [Stenotrophomonas sp. HITSZ_GD]|uniref:hypothetical protein n=1 Tax=Stenotrophomonas sp. HITSZ_GD TaxID=3037248 RepID=UPI00102A0376|nr:hypothetical protein [Stenotrophomonas sp. HITSZ_GD]MDG2524633.1 hypothetical protein [Stenotrophomonas sp. HITSZ_GD]